MRVPVNRLRRKRNYKRIKKVKFYQRHKGNVGKITGTIVWQSYYTPKHVEKSFNIKV